MTSLFRLLSPASPTSSPQAAYALPRTLGLGAVAGRHYEGGKAPACRRRFNPYATATTRNKHCLHVRLAIDSSRTHCCTYEALSPRRFISARLIGRALPPTRQEPAAWATPTFLWARNFMPMPKPKLPSCKKQAKAKQVAELANWPGLHWPPGCVLRDAATIEISRPGRTATLRHTGRWTRRVINGQAARQANWLTNSSVHPVCLLVFWPASRRKHSKPLASSWLLGIQCFASPVTPTSRSERPLPWLIPLAKRVLPKPASQGSASRTR